MTGKPDEKPISLNLSVSHKTLMFVLSLIGSLAGGSMVKATGFGEAPDSLARIPETVREIGGEIDSTKKEVARQRETIDSTRREVRDIKAMVEDIYCDKYPKSYRCRVFK